MMTPVYQEWHSSIFAAHLELLEDRVLRVIQKDPVNYKSHPYAKFLMALRKAMKACLEDPTQKQYLLGSYLGESHRHWRRIKHGMPNRYRLFFLFSSEDLNVIFAWLNDEKALRREGHRSDVYQVFLGLISSGRLPNSYNELLSESRLFTKPD